MRKVFLSVVFSACYFAPACVAEQPHNKPAKTSMLSKDKAQIKARKTLLSYVRNQNTTGFLVMRGNEILIEENWQAPKDKMFSLFVYNQAKNGALLEDVASQQKSFIAVLVGIAVDKGLLQLDKPVSQYIGTAWSKATPEQEAKITVSHLLEMNSGLTKKFKYSAPAGTTFHYNTPVYAVLKKILQQASKKNLTQITNQWLVGPMGMTQTGWRKRPAALANVGNPTGLVTSPRDTARFGRMILDQGMTRSGKHIISQSSLQKIFQPSQTNPAYGQLWWLNQGEYIINAQGKREDRRLIASAPDDLIAAFGFLNRRLYLVPSLDLVVVRTGAAAPDANFDATLWNKLLVAIPYPPPLTLYTFTDTPCQ